MKYKLPDSTQFITTYGQLRSWAEDCKEAKKWMRYNLPKEILEEDAPAFKLGNVYMMSIDAKRYKPKRYLCSRSGGGYHLVSLNGDVSWCQPERSIEALSVSQTDFIVEDLGPITDLMR